VVRRDGVGDLLQQRRLPGFGRGDDEAALPLSDRRDEVKGPHRELLGRGLEANPLIRVEEITRWNGNRSFESSGEAVDRLSCTSDMAPLMPRPACPIPSICIPPSLGLGSRPRGRRRRRRLGGSCSRAGAGIRIPAPAPRARRRRVGVVRTEKTTHAPDRRLPRICPLVARHAPGDCADPCGRANYRGGRPRASAAAPGHPPGDRPAVAQSAPAAFPRRADRGC
jgi:hypothetical protein